MSTSFSRENLKRVRERIAEAAIQAGRSPAAVRLIAVSKTVAPEVALAAYAAGQRAFGENRPAELLRKQTLLPPDCEWHMIGHLQRNKVRAVLQSARWIHSVDSPALLERLDRLASEEKKSPLCLIQVNVTGEDSKFGIRPEEAPALMEKAAACSAVRCRGLMTMAPFGAPPATLRRAFAALRELRDDLAGRFDLELPELSMGMSGDFVQAIAEGATMVRVGTAVFGARQ